MMLLLLTWMSHLAHGQETTSPKLSSYPNFNVQSLRVSVDSNRYFMTTESTIQPETFSYKAVYSYTDAPFTYTTFDQNQYEVVASLNQMDLIGSYALERFRFGLIIPTYLNATGYRADQFQQLLLDNFASNPITEPFGIGDMSLDFKYQIRSRGLQRAGLFTTIRSTLPTSQSYLPLGYSTPVFDIELGADKQQNDLHLVANLGHQQRPSEVLENTTTGAKLYGRFGASYHDQPKKAGVAIEYSTGVDYQSGAMVEQELTASLWRPTRRHILRTGFSLGLGDGIATPAYRILLSVQPKSRSIIASPTMLPPTQKKEDNGTSSSETSLGEGPSGMVSVHIQDQEGNPIPGVWMLKDIESKLRSTDNPHRLSQGTYPIQIRAKGYRPISKSIEVNGDQEITVQLTASKANIEGQQIITVDTVRFTSETADIMASSHRLLDDIVYLLRENSSIVRIQIEGHTASSEDPAADQTLSSQRAEAVRSYLIDQGIVDSRLEVIGYGSTKPIASDDTVEGQQLNQRIYFNILAIEQ